VDFDVVSYTSGALRITVGGNFTTYAELTGAAMAAGRKSVLVLGGAITARGVEFYGGAVTATIDNISVKLLAGNHATQATSTQRPIYGINPITGTRNLLLQTENFTVSPWAAAVLGTSTRTNTTSPYAFGLGLITVTSANGGIRQSRSGLTSGQPYALSFYLESATPNINVVFENGATGFGATHVASIDPSTGAFSAVSGFTSTTSVVFGTGRIYTLVSAPAGGSLIANIEWRVTAASGSFLLGRPQFEASTTATAYQKVVSQYEVTQAGVQSASYLAFDGVDDGMVTPTITPGINKAQVFAGARKLSDSASGMLVELGDGTSQPGIFGFRFPSLALSGATFSSRGTSSANATAGGIPAPSTNVLTGLGDIVAPSSILRSNGIQLVTDTTSQGTGNFLAYPIYIGRRAGTSNPFNGRLYSLIVRFGANLTDGQITSTESWVNGETGAY
jgi:hypothetical protein